MKTKLALLGAVLCIMQLFAAGKENETVGYGFVKKEASSYPEPKYAYFKDIQDEKNLSTALNLVTFDDLKKHNKIVATGDGYDYKIIKFRLCVFESDAKGKPRLNDNFFDFTGDSIGSLFFLKLKKNRVYTFSIEEVKVATPDSQIITFQGCNYYNVFPDSTYLLADKYYPKLSEPRKAKYNIRISLEGDVSQEDKEILKKIVADYNSVLSTIKVKIVKHFPTIRIILNKKPKYNIYINKGVSSTINTSTSSEKSILFFPELKIHKDVVFYSAEGLKNKTFQNSLYKELADVLNSFDKHYLEKNYSKSNIIGNSYQNTLFKDLADELNSLNEKEYGYFVKKYLDRNPVLTHEDKMALKIMFSPGYDKIINEIYGTNKEPISTYFLLVIIFSIIVFIIGYELLVYFSIERIKRYKLILNIIAVLIFVQFVILAMYLFSPFHPGFLDPLSKYNFYFSIYAVLCVLLFLGSDILQNKIKTKFLQLIANPVITLVVLFLAYQIIYLFVRGERLQFQTINRDAVIIGVTIMVVRFYLFYEQSKIVSLIQEKEYELTRQKELKNRAELNALQARINPHFLYNALNSIASLAHTSAERTEKMALSLSKLFRYNVNRESELSTSLGEELEMVQLYLEIEKQRFGERLNFNIEADKQLYDKQIPRFLIQPLVENSIKHGISKITGEGIIKLKIYAKDKGFCIEIHDNGPAFPSNDLVNGYGLQNTYDKLNLVYKRPYELKFINTDGKYLLINLQ